MAKRIQVGGRIESKEVGGIVTGAAEILDDAKGKKQSVINGETDDELLRLDQSKQDNLTFDNAPTDGSDNPVKSGGVYAAQQAILLAIAAINELIPSAASTLNQLADKAFVNSSISTNTATFRGTSAAGLNEQQFLAWANGLEHDLNDYVFWQTSDAAGNTLFKRYKWNGTEWAYEYTLNNSTFTAEQWEAIQSGITALLVAKLRALPTAQELIQSFDSKQNVLTFDDVPTLGSTNPVKSSGIYNVIKAITDLIPAEATAQNQLADKADVAAKIVAAIPSWKGQYDALTDLQAVTGAKAGDMGCVKATDSDGHAVLTFYQYSAQGAWVVYYTLRHYAQNKPATTGTTGDYPYNGMGRIELQKNIVNGVNTLTQAMLTQQNTIYVIQYDFTLGEDITIPANCGLEFDGGSISGNGTITGNNTGIQAGLVKIFNTNVTLAGTWNVIEVYPEWFGAKNDGTVDCSVAIDTVINLNTDNNLCVRFSTGEYLISGDVITIKRSNLILKGNETKIITNSSASYNSLITSENGHSIKNVLIDGIIFNQLSDTVTPSVGSATCAIIKLPHISELTITNCIFYFYGSQAVIIATIYQQNIVIDNNKFYFTRKGSENYDTSALYVEAKSFRLSNNYIDGLYGFDGIECRGGIECHGKYYQVLNNQIRNCYAAINATGHNSEVTNNECCLICGNISDSANFILIYPYKGIKNLVISNNVVNITGLRNPNYGAIYVNAEQDAQFIETLDINNNMFVSYVIGQQYHSAITINEDTVVKNLFIRNNTIKGFTRNGIYIGQTSGVTDCSITDNKFIDCSDAVPSPSTSSDYIVCLINSLNNLFFERNSFIHTVNNQKVLYNLVVNTINNKIRIMDNTSYFDGDGIFEFDRYNVPIDKLESNQVGLRKELKSRSGQIRTSEGTHLKGDINVVNNPKIAVNPVNSKVFSSGGRKNSNGTFAINNPGLPYIELGDYINIGSDKVFVNGKVGRILYFENINSFTETGDVGCTPAGDTSTDLKEISLV